MGHDVQRADHMIESRLDRRRRLLDVAPRRACPQGGPRLPRRAERDRVMGRAPRAALVRSLGDVEWDARKSLPELTRQIRILTADRHGERRNVTNQLESDVVNTKHER